MKERSVFIKQLIYRSNNRGCKETDLLLGTFAYKHLSELTDEELVQFSHLLEEPDWDIYNYLTGKDQIPEHLKTDVMEKLLKFKFYK
jgi:succinate dehydrogenase flavin-adding protein (antitoxin of CptAB toxin-antitoxin module)